MNSRLTVALMAAGCLTASPVFAQSSGTSTPPATGTPSTSQSAPAQPGTGQPVSPMNQGTPSQGTTPAPSGTQSGTKKTMPGNASMKAMKPQSASSAAWGEIKNDPARVKQLQEALKSKGQDPGAADGVMGPKTMAALRSYQQAENVRGVNDTLAKLGISQ